LASGPSPGLYADVARYGTMWRNEREVGVFWDDPRDVFYVVLRFVSLEGINPETIRIQYWQRNWPRHRIPKGKRPGTGRVGWMPLDDWWNGEWKDADTDLEVDGSSLIFSFRPINLKEFPEIEDFDIRERRTLKVRALLKEREGSRISGFETYTDSVWKEETVLVEWGSGGGEKIWDGHVEIYNGELISIEPMNELTRLSGKGSWISKVSGTQTSGIMLKLFYMWNEDPNSYDETIVTIRAKSHSFSFSMRDIERGEEIFVRDFDVLAVKGSLGSSLRFVEEKVEGSKRKTFYDRIFDMPEQTFQRAWGDMPRKKRFYAVLGCEGGRQKFGIEPNGTVFCPENWIRRVRGRDTERLVWDGREIRYSFGFPDVEPSERWMEDGFLPIMHTKWNEDGMVYKQEAFASTLMKDILEGLKEKMEGDDIVVLLLKISMRNEGDVPKPAKLRFSARSEHEESLVYLNGLVFSEGYRGSPWVREGWPGPIRYYLALGPKGHIKKEGSDLLYEVALKPGEEEAVYVRIPFVTILSDEEIGRLKSFDHDLEKEKVRRYWISRIEAGSVIETPNEVLNRFYKANLIHILITDDREPGSDRYIARVGSLGYGAFGNESCMVIRNLDRRGYKEEAEKRLDTFVRYQGTAPLPGNFSSHDGVFYGAGGYESGGYNQHHGWILWCLAEHYRYTRDEEWLKRVAPAMVKGCDWIIEQRKSTFAYDEEGRKVLEYGFLPAGALEDVKEYWYWLATNAYAYLGIKSAAEVLSEIGHPDGPRLSSEAEAYRMDLERGFEESMVRSPVVKLRDGTWVPHFPSRLNRRGRDFGWIREVLEGAMHLIICGLVDPNSKEATWIIKDYEDNLYISDHYGYPVREEDWFSLGGFSMQPNLLPHPVPYLLRDEVKHFLRGYFNAFAVAFYPDTCLLTEHPLPTIYDWAGDHYKTSDESQSVHWFSSMLFREDGDRLILLQAIPSEWLEHGKRIRVERAMTYFGPLSFEVESFIDNGEIRISLDPPKRNPPREIRIRLRIPEGSTLRKVVLNGKEEDPSKFLW
jgi:hypothetical protein